MSTIEEALQALQATLAKRDLDEKAAAAREEQREACARLFETTPSWEPERAHQEAAFVRSTPLTATPLADTIKDLRADVATAKSVITQQEAELIVTENLVEALETELRQARQQFHDAVSAVSAAEKTDGASTPRPPSET